MRRVDSPQCQIGARLFARVDLIDIDDTRLIDFPRSGHPASSALSACHSLSYTTCTVFRQDVDKLRITDSTLQIDDSTLQISTVPLEVEELQLVTEAIVVERASRFCKYLSQRQFLEEAEAENL